DDAALPFARMVEPGAAPRAARVIAREPDRIVIAPPGAGRLVVADLVYPGWRVTIDGHRATALEQGDLRAVQVPAGARRVVWTFTPPGARAGVAVSVVALAVLLAIPFAPRLRRRRRGGPAGVAAVAAE